VVWFIAPKLAGGRDAVGAVGGAGVARMSEAWKLERLRTRRFGEDLALFADVARRE